MRDQGSMVEKHGRRFPMGCNLAIYTTHDMMTSGQDSNI